MLATTTRRAATTTSTTTANKQTEFVLCQQQRGVCAMFAEIYTSFEQQHLREGACDALHFKHLFMYIQVTVKKKERAENTETAKEDGGKVGKGAWPGIDLWVRSLFNFATFCISQGNFHVDYISFVPHNAPLRLSHIPPPPFPSWWLKFCACRRSKSGKDD